MADERKCRAYNVTCAAAYLRSRVGEDEWRRIHASFSPETRETLARSKPSQWVLMSHFTELNTAIATSLGGGDEEATRTALRESGTSIAAEATSTLFKLFMRVLTPPLFVSKLPTVWARDFDFGRVVASVEDRTTGRFEFSEIEGCNHLAPAITGFCTFVLRTMGKKVEPGTLTPYSLSNPGPANIEFTLTWS